MRERNLLNIYKIGLGYKYISANSPEAGGSSDIPGKSAVAQQLGEVLGKPGRSVWFPLQGWVEGAGMWRNPACSGRAEKCSAVGE